MGELLMVVARRLVVAAAALVLTSVPLEPALAQEGELALSTPYPAVAVEPGETHTFPLRIDAPPGTRVDLAVIELPEGWEASLRGGGFHVSGVTVSGEEPPGVELEVTVPPGVGEGEHRVVVEASSGAGSATLPVDLRIAEAVGGSVALEAEFPALRGASDGTFAFDLDLANDTPEETTFTLEAAGPPGWVVEARPSGEARAATVTVAGGESAGITVDVDPPDDTTAGTYEVGVRAAGGGRSAEAVLEVEITGNVAMALTTADERLNLAIEAGSPGDVELVVRNDGTAPLTAVELSSTDPSGWETEFEPALIEVVEPGESATAVARITPTSEAVAGDYVVTVSANAEGASDEIELRTTVETSRVWGLIGIGLILVTFAGLGLVFQRYGRR